jgi:hypothetical protein
MRPPLPPSVRLGFRVLHRSVCLMRRTPPSQAQRKAVSAIAIGYQAGPRCIGIAAMAPAMPTMNPMTPNAHT